MPVLWLTVSEPKRGAMAETFAPEPIGPTLGFLASQQTFVIVLIGFCLTTYTNYATAAWIPPFLARVHHLSSVEIGTYAGTFKGLCGMAGTLVGGFVVRLRVAKSIVNNDAAAIRELPLGVMWPRVTLAKQGNPKIILGLENGSKRGQDRAEFCGKPIKNGEGGENEVESA